MSHLKNFTLIQASHGTSGNISGDTAPTSKKETTKCEKTHFYSRSHPNASTSILYGLPWWLSGKESACQCSRHGFNPWAGKIPWRKKWQPTPVFLPGKSHGPRSLVGYSPWGRKKVEHNLASKQQQLHLNNVLKMSFPTFFTFVSLSVFFFLEEEEWQI